MHGVLDELHKAYIDIQIAGQAGQPITAAVSAMKVVGLKFLKIGDRSWLYAGPRGFHVVQQLITQLAEAREWETKSFSSTHIAHVSDLLDDAAVVLSEELRNQMQMEPIDAKAAKALRQLRPKSDS